MSVAAPAVDDVFRDAHLAARGFFEWVLHPVVGEKRHPRPGFSIRGANVRTHTSTSLFDGARDGVRRLVLGRGEGEIAHLRASSSADAWQLATAALR